MQHILRTYFLIDTLNMIEEKYRDIVFSDFEKHFIYANVFETMNYYKPYSFKKYPDYKLYEKINNYKRIDVVKFLINEIYEDNYNPDLVLLVYSYITSYIYNEMIDEYIKNHYFPKIFSTKKRQMKVFSKYAKLMEAQFYYERTNQKISKHKLDINQITLKEKSSETIKKMIQNLFLFTLGSEVFEHGLNNFYKYQKQNYKGSRTFGLLTARICESFTRSKKYSMTTVYNTNKTIKKDYLNKEKLPWDNKEENLSFYELYDAKLKEAAKILNLLSEKIYYKKKNGKEIEKLMNKE